MAIVPQLADGLRQTVLRIQIIIDNKYKHAGLKFSVWSANHTLFALIYNTVLAVVNKALAIKTKGRRETVLDRQRQSPLSVVFQLIDRISDDQDLRTDGPDQTRFF